MGAPESLPPGLLLLLPAGALTLSWNSGLNSTPGHSVAPAILPAGLVIHKTQINTVVSCCNGNEVQDSLHNKDLALCCFWFDVWGALYELCAAP